MAGDVPAKPEKSEPAPKAQPVESGKPADTVAAIPVLDEAAAQAKREGETQLQELARRRQEALADHNEAGAGEARKAEEELQARLKGTSEPKTDTGTTTPEATGGDPDKKEESVAKKFLEEFIEGIKAIFAKLAAILGPTSEKPPKEDDKDKDKKDKKAPKRTKEAITMEEEPVDIPDAPIVERYEAVHASERLAPITHIILHTSDGSGSGANLAQYLADPGDGKEVSSHFVVDRNGDLYQTCSLGKQAWHTKGKDLETGEYYNQESIGIDLANYTSGGEPFNEEQYVGLAKLISYLMKKYSIPFDNIIGHQEVDDNRGDPGPLFDWKKLKSMIEQRLV